MQDFVHPQYVKDSRMNLCFPQKGVRGVLEPAGLVVLWVSHLSFKNQGFYSKSKPPIHSTNSGLPDIRNLAGGPFIQHKIPYRMLDVR